ncbi:MAG: hypothetical protein JNL62_08435 [Bryobacterales bacterium]|nr:hypothetical protein [Bryobacterales bacterium]
MNLIEWTGMIVAVWLQVAIISRLLSGAYRLYPMLLVFMAVNFLANVASASAIFGSREWTAQASRMYWLCNTVQYGFVFALQVHMLSQGMRGPRARRRVAYLIAGGIVFAVIAVWTAHHPRMNLWMTQVVRNIGFGSMILNLALWTSLLRNPERCRLMITAAIGIMLAGEAIGHSLRQMAQGLVPLGNSVLVLTYFLALVLIWRGLARFGFQATEEPSAALHPTG